MVSLIRRHWFPILLFCATALFFTYPSRDVDLGWHLRYGESFLTSGRILKTNEFSWELPEYRWANHSWGFDVIAAALFGGSRFWLLSVSAGCLIALALLTAIPASVSLATVFTLTVFWYFGTELLSIGLRSQLFSLLFTALLWKWILAVVVNQESRAKTASSVFVSGYWLIPMFLLWANLHGQFIYGLAVMALSVIPYIWKNRSRTTRRRMAGLLAASFGVTLINPFGINLWQTAIGHFNAPELKYIYEWMPWELNTVRMALLLIYAGVFWLGIRKLKLTLPVLLPLAATTVLALSSRRMIPYFLLLSAPLFVTVIETYLKGHFYNQLAQFIRSKRAAFIAAAGLMVFGYAGFSGRGIFNQSWDTYCRSNAYCSEKAVAYMRENRIAGKLFNAYRLGGYLIYRYPDMKPMVDGRMTLWREADGSSPFMDYTSIVYTEPGSRERFYQLNPDYVLIQPQYPLAQTLLKEGDWPVIYSDDRVLLFRNPYYAETD